ncbi:MAG: helix-turn-helix transcriptional regulator, partial [Rhodoblastus sp.]
LNRRLSAEGRTFRQLANEARFVVAQQLLAGTRMPVTSVALALGYADASAFTHAFQRTVGLAPSEWRAKLRADDGEAAFD